MLGRVVDLLRSGFFSPDDRSRGAAIAGYLEEHDPFLVCADFDDYLARHRGSGCALSRQARVDAASRAQYRCDGSFLERRNDPPLRARHLEATRCRSRTRSGIRALVHRVDSSEPSPARSGERAKVPSPLHDLTSAPVSHVSRDCRRAPRDLRKRRRLDVRGYRNVSRCAFSTPAPPSSATAIRLDAP